MEVSNSNEDVSEELLVVPKENEVHVEEDGAAQDRLTLEFPEGVEVNDTLREEVMEQQDLNFPS